MDTVSPANNNENNNQITLLQGDALEMLRTLPDEFINAGITSPPYFGLRNYGIEGQLGLEKTLEEYIANLVAVFAHFAKLGSPKITKSSICGSAVAAAWTLPYGRSGSGTVA